MGVWGPGLLENDDAADWLGALLDTRHVPAIADAIRAVPDKGYIAADVGAIALAACVVAAALRGQGAVAVPEGLQSWIDEAREPLPAAVSQAEIVRTVARVLSADSELAELWAEGDGREAGLWRDGARSLATPA